MALENIGEHHKMQRRTGPSYYASKHPFKLAQTYVAGLVRSGDFIALIQKTKPKHLAGYWNLPGGKVEEGETYERAMAREMKEETSLDTQAYDWKIYAAYRYVDSECHNLVYFLRCDLSNTGISLHRDCKTMESETVAVSDWRKACWGAGIKLVPNLRFLIPLGLSAHTGLGISYFEEISK